MTPFIAISLLIVALAIVLIATIAVPALHEPRSARRQRLLRDRWGDQKP